jgi:hypothetical protein
MVFDYVISNKAISEMIKKEPGQERCLAAARRAMKHHKIEPKYFDLVAEAFLYWQDATDEKLEERVQFLNGVLEDLCGEYSSAYRYCSEEHRAVVSNGWDKKDMAYWKSMKGFMVKRCNRFFTLFGWVDSPSMNDFSKPIPVHEYWYKTGKKVQK